MSLFYWPLCCLSFLDLRIRITPLVYSNFSGFFFHSRTVRINLLLLYIWCTLSDITTNIFRLRFGLWCLTPLSTVFQLCRGDQFYCSRQLEYPEKTTDLSQVTYPEIMCSLLIYISKMAVSSSQKFLQRFLKEIYCSGVRAFF